MKSPAVILYDANGVAMSVADGVAIPAGTQGLLVAGKEGSNSRFLRTAADGTLRIDPTGTTSQPVLATQGAPAAGTSRWPIAVTDTADAVVRPGDAGNNAVRVNIVAGNQISGNTTGTGALNALNAAVSVALAGQRGAAVQFLAGSLVGTVIAELSVDGGTTWNQVPFKQPSGTLVRSFTTGGFDATRGIPLLEGTTHVRVRVSAFTSGATTANLVATTAINSIPTERATFTVAAYSSAIALNKSMISLVNGAGSGVVLRLLEAWIVNAQTTPVTGVVAQFDLQRITTHSGGSLLTVQPHDSDDTLSSAVTARTNASTGSAPGPSLRRGSWSSDEWGVGTLDQEGYDHGVQMSQPWWRAPVGGKPILLSPGQGVSIAQLTNSTAGSFDLWFVFTQE